MWKHNASGVIYRMGGCMKWSISAKDEWPKGRVATATEQRVLVENVRPLWEKGLSPNLVWYSVAVPTYIPPRPNPFMFLRVITETPFQSDCRVGFSGETVISGLTKTCTHWPRIVRNECNKYRYNYCKNTTDSAVRCGRTALSAMHRESRACISVTNKLALERHIKTFF